MSEGLSLRWNIEVALRALLHPLAVLALVLPALAPLSRGLIPNTPDGLNHFYRIVELDWHIRHGVLYPRFMADLYHGFGYPLLNFYPPLVYYLALPFHWLGADFTLSFLALNGLTLYVGALGALRLAAELFGDLAGYVAAAAVTYAPYTLLNVVQRGAIPEAWALALLPWLLWVFYRIAIAKRPSARDLALGAFLYAALLLSHTLMAALITIVLLAWIVVSHQASGVRRQATGVRRQASGIRRQTGSLLAGAGLAAFFWLPALAEARWVQLEQAFAPAGLDFRGNFVSVRELSSLPQPFDPRLVVQELRKSLGWPQAALAAAALGMAIRGRRWPGVPGSGRLPGFLALGALVCMLMALPVSRPVWEAVPPLRFVQFPWRFLGLASVFLGLLAGAAIEIAPSAGRGRAGLAGAAFVGLAVYGTAWSLVGYAPRIENADIYDLRDYEAPGVLGTTLAGEYLPIWVKELPRREALADRYAARPVIERLDREALPAGVQVIESHSGLLDANVSLAAQETVTLTFDWFYFPGWRAQVDGREALIRITPSTGRISVAAPAGRHVVRVWFGETPLRALADGISLVSLVVLGAAVWARRSRTTEVVTTNGTTEVVTTNGVRSSDFSRSAPTNGVRSSDFSRSATGLLIGILGVGVFLFRAIYVESGENPFYRSRFDGQAVAGLQTPLSANFGGELALMGLDADSRAVAAGEELDFALYWRALRPLERNYSVSAHLLDVDGLLYGQADNQHPSGYATSWWRPDQYARDSHRLQVLPGAPPGAYRLVIGVYNQASGISLPLLDDAGNPAGLALTAAEIRVSRPAAPPSDADLAPRNPLQVQLGPLELVGADVWTPTAEAGHDLGMTLFWRAWASRLPDLRTRLELRSADGMTFASVEGYPAREDYPTSDWAAGEAVRAGRRVRIPATAPEGPASVWVGLVTPDGRQVAGPAQAFTVSIRHPQRTSDIPVIAYPLRANFQNRIELLGYDLRRIESGEAILLTLYWRALAEMETSYTVFTHLLAADGRLWAGRDSIPLAGARPTSGWLAGEVLTDERRIPLDPAIPAGEYWLEAGWYDAATGARLAALGADGQPLGDSVRLTTITVP